MVTSHHRGVQTCSLRTAESEPSNCGLWVVVMCRWGLILGKIRATLASTVGNGGGRACVRAGRCGNSLHLPLKFVVNPKLL